MPPLPPDAKHCPGYTGFAVDTESNVFSCRSSHWDNGKPLFTKKWKPVKKNNHINGYEQVTISIGKGEQKTKKVHLLVLEAFVGPKPEGLMCCHNDGNKKNSRLDNLRWDTASSNARDIIKHGGTYSVGISGEKSHSAKYSDKLIQDAYLCALATTPQIAAKRFGIPKNYMKTIVNGKSRTETIKAIPDELIQNATPKVPELVQKFLEMKG